VVDGGHAGIVVADGDAEPVEEALDVDGAALVGLGVPVHVRQQLGHPERRQVDQRIEAPRPQLRHDDPAYLADP
jgi:hypothetical protein